MFCAPANVSFSISVPYSDKLHFKSVYMLFFSLGCFLVYSIGLLLYGNSTLSGNELTYIIQLYMFIALIAAVKLFNYTPEEIGLNNNKLKFNIILGLSLGIPGAIICIGLRFFMLKIGHQEYEMNPSPMDFIDGFLIYPLIVILQEVVTKGLFFSYLHQLFSKRSKKLLISSIITSLIFAQFHSFYNINVFILTFLYTFFTCYLFSKTYSITGIAIIHYLTGMSLFFGSKIF